MKKITYMKKFFIYIFVFIFASLFLFSTKIIAATSAVEMVWTQAGEDASTELLISWHSSFAKGTLYFTYDSDTSFKEAVIIEANGVYNNTAYSFDKVSFYEFEVSMKDLIPDTRYRYKIKCGTVTSQVYTCKTAGNSGNFNFLWIGDNHAYKIDSCTTRYTYLNTMVKALNDQGFNFDYAISTGDNVSYGGSYDNFQVLNGQVKFFKDTVYSNVPGNHEYYGSHNEYPDSSVNIDNRFYEANYSHPQNGINNPLDSSYYVIYNSILFVMLDSLAASYSSTLTAQKTWFERIVTENEGKFQYLIVCQHYPWMNALTGAHSGPYSSNFDKWHELFDKYGVDLALGGDHHVYYRSNIIYNNEIITDTSKGTVYVGCPQIGDRYRTITQRLDEEYYAVRIDNVATDPNFLKDYSGITAFEVSPTEIKAKLIDTSGSTRDSYVVKAKRDISWSDKKDNFPSSLTQSFNGSKAYIDFSPSYSEYIEKIRVYEGNTLIKSVFPSKYSIYSIELEGLNANSIYSYKLVIDYVDGTVRNLNYDLNTYGNYGTFDSFKVNAENEKIVLSWNQDINSDIIKNYQIFKDNTLVETITSSSRSFEINKSSVTISSKYTIKALASNGDVIFTKDAKYNTLGDCNFDGKVDTNDVTSLFKKINSSYKFKDNELTLLDLNKDSKVDVGDSILIYEYIKNEIEAISTKTLYTVSILNKDGSIKKSLRVAYGENILLDDISDDNFLYYTSNGKYITGDTIIRPVYR